MPSNIDAMLARERSYFETATYSDQIWFRFCPQPIGCDLLLKNLQQYLESIETRSELETCDANGRYPDTVVAGLRSLGLSRIFCETGLEAPKATAYHLAALSFMTARLTGSLAISVGVNSLALLAAYHAASPQQLKTILDLVRSGDFSALALTELECGSDLRQIRSHAIAGTLSGTGAFQGLSDGEYATHYLLNAYKQLINGATLHPLVFLLVKSLRCEPGDKDPHLDRGAHTLFWIKTEGLLAPGGRWHTLSAPGADISELRLEDVVIDASHRIGSEGDGLRLIRETLAMSRGGVAALAVGILSRANDLTLAYASRRKLYGRQIGELGAIAGHLARLDALVRAATAASLRAAAWVNACGVHAAHYTAVAKLMSCRFAEEGVAQGRDVLGARSLLRQLPYAQLIDDVLLYGVFDGTKHLMLDELQMYLSMETRQWVSDKAAQRDTVAISRAVYALSPQSLVGISHTRPALRPFPMAMHARNIADIRGDYPIRPVAELAETLLGVTAAAKRKERWGRDQQLRFALAEVYAFIEVILALIELCDPIRRLSFASPKSSEHPADEVGYQHALSWLATKACAKLLESTGEIGEDINKIAAIQAQFAEEQGERRKELATSLLQHYH